MTTQSLHAASYNPLFDQLVAEVGPAPARVTPITTSSVYLHRSSANAADAADAVHAADAARTAGAARAASRERAATAAQARPVTPERPSGRRAAREMSIDAHRLAAKPLTISGLTDDEQKVVSQMGGTVARLILQMLDNDPLDAKTAALASALAR